MVWIISEESRLGITLICSGGVAETETAETETGKKALALRFSVVIVVLISHWDILLHFPFISDLRVTLLPVQERNIVSSHSVHFRGLTLRRASVFGANDLKIQFSPILYDSWLPETTEQFVYFMGEYSISQSHSEYSLDTENKERSKEEKLSRQPGP